MQHGSASRGLSSAGNDALGQLLRGQWPDPDGGTPIGVPVQSIAIERTLAGLEADLVEPLRLGPRLAIVSDSTTHIVLGERVERALAKLAAVDVVVLDGQPHADAATVETVRRASARADALVAVGSGTVNDLCKYAAAQDGKRYAVFATAPSMNGYTSQNAAITVDGHKMSLAAVSPVGVFIDLAVLSAAPGRMIRAGLGDSLCRTTAQADWLLSHHVRGTAYRQAPFALLAEDEPALLDAPEALLRGDPDAMRALARTLVLSGLGMTISGGSYPASQGEHLISHYIDMFAPKAREAFLHGEQVGVATLTMARIQQQMLAADPPRPLATTMDCAELQRRFGDEVGASCWREFSAKRVLPEARAMLEQRLARPWNAIRDEIQRLTIPVQRLRSVLERAGCPTEPAQIGLSDAFYARAVRDARFLRDRYTFLDLADDAGHGAMMAAA